MFRFTVLLFACALAVSACGTLEIGIEKSPTPDLPAIATLVGLMLEGTEKAALATERAIPVTPAPPVGSVSGRVCYPSENIPGMTAYFVNLANNHMTELSIATGQEQYSIDLTPGDYVAFAWAPDYQVGGMYSAAVRCGLTVACTDHSPQAFQVSAGKRVSRVDLCDWVIPAEDLPLPPDFELPGLDASNAEGGS